MSQKPNVIFFFVDQQRWDTVGCYGQKLNITPNLDKLSEIGVRFENAFTCQPVCGPARACIQTGKYATEIGCYRNGIALPLDEKTLAHYFKEAGYDVAYVGKWHLASTNNEIDYSTLPIPLERRGGYDGYYRTADVLEFTSHGYDGYVYDEDSNMVEFKGYRPDCITDFALDYIRDYEKDKPFFMFMSHIEPHHQNDRNRYEGPDGSKEKFKNYEVPGDLLGTGGDWRENYPDYLGCCNSLDYNVGRVLDVLKEKGISENTIIIYTSDHGSHFKTRNNEYKRSCHDGCIRIPMIAYGPGFKGGKVVENLVSLIDIPPTLLACGNIKKPAQMKGRPLQDLVSGTAENWPEEVFLQISESQVGRAIRTKKWKYSVCAFDKHGWNDSCSNTYTEECLYNLEKDPYEKNNLVSHADYEKVRKVLRERLIKRMVEAEETAPEIYSR
jgi:arylsulfatase A-like enzyme